MKRQSEETMAQQSKKEKLHLSEMKELEKQIERLPGLEKWFVDILPQSL